MDAPSRIVETEPYHPPESLSLLSNLQISPVHNPAYFRQGYDMSIYEGSSGLEQSYKDLRFPPPSQMQSELDRRAAAFVCNRHYYLRSELETLRPQYERYNELARTYAIRIEEIQANLDDLTLNVNEIFCDALDSLRWASLKDAAINVAKPVQHDDICDLFHKSVSLAG